MRKPPRRTRTTSTCCRTRITARRPTGRAREIRFLRSVWPEGAVRHRAGRRGSPLHGRLPSGEREGRGPREGQRLIRAGLRRRHRVGEHRHHADDGAAPRHPADHLHAQRRRRTCRLARSAARAHRFARDRIAEGAQYPVPDQEPAAARHSSERNRESLTARARLFDDHRLQDAQAHVRQAPG